MRISKPMNQLVTAEMSLSAVIFAYNEEQGISETIENVLRAFNANPSINYSIIVIDDGSLDETGKIIGNYAKKDKNIIHITNKKNMGIGASIRKGIAITTKKKIMFLPGDNDVPYDLIRELVDKAFIADIVMTYFKNDAIRSPLRVFLSSAYTNLYLLLFGIRVKYINGPAVYDSFALKNIALHSKRFSIVAEINTKLITKGCSVCEIGGYRTNDGRTSGAFSVKNFIDILVNFVRLFLEVKVWHRQKYISAAKRKCL
jgi:glycosyltransferase involved in cell wall biosynthesis